MKSAPLLLGFCLLAPGLIAAPPHPTVLRVKYKDKMLEVVRVHRDDPYVIVDGHETLIRSKPLYFLENANGYSDNFVQTPRSLSGKFQMRVLGDHYFNDREGGISATITGDRVAGLLGELHPASPVWRDEPRILLVEVAIAGLRSGRLEVTHVALPPTTPPVTRDVALIIPATATVGQVVDVARGAVSRATDIELFDLFAGPPLALGERSAGLRFTFQPTTTGADDAAIAAELSAFEGAVLRSCGARIRGTEGQ
jgi:hypothetical protein